MISLFAIRKVGTNDYMPAHKSGKGGFSKDDPVPEGGPFGPRLLPSRRTAVNAISAWKQGLWYLNRSGSYDDYEEELTCDVVPGRDTIELEIVEVTLREIRCDRYPTAKA